MKKKNAFTLIELLAIIVILAIIAVITVPIILNIIENSRKGAAQDSAYGFKDSVNKYYVGELSKNLDYGVLNGEYTVTNGILTKTGTSDVLNIETDGTKPTSGSLTYENNVLTGGCLVIDDYAVTFGSNGSVLSTNKGTCQSSNDQRCSDFSSPQFGYKSLDETEPIICGSNPTGLNAYLKYSLTNGTVAEGTIPEACIDFDIYGGELCLSVNDYESSTQKIKTYFGYTTTGANAWTETAGSTWENPTQTIECFFSTTTTWCHSSNSSANLVSVEVNNSGYVSVFRMTDQRPTSCYLGDGSYECIED